MQLILRTTICCVVFLLVTSCEEGREVQVVSPFVSGYAASDSDWTEVIDCWQEHVRKTRANSRPPGHWTAWKARTGGAFGQEARVRDLEARLKSPLPASYRDFLRLTDGRVQRRGAIEEAPMFRSADQVEPFAKVLPEFAAIWQSGGDPKLVESEYLVYDLRQYQVSFRPQFISELLLVGHRDDSTQILLNPMVRTRDGEWEAWILSPSIPGAIRYPSFAHLIRDLILADIVSPRDEGPYSAKQHRGQCSDLIKVTSAF